jgi:hypothetical protein
MKELKEEIYYSKDFDIEVKKYLTYAQIQKIVETTIKYKTWAERQTNIDMMVLCYTTNIGVDKIQEIGIDKLVMTGLVDEVQYVVVNYNKIYDGIQYHESVAKALFELSEKLPEIKNTLQKELNNK